MKFRGIKIKNESQMLMAAQWRLGKRIFIKYGLLYNVFIPIIIIIISYYVKMNYITETVDSIWESPYNYYFIIVCIVSISMLCATYTLKNKLLRAKLYIKNVVRFEDLIFACIDNYKILFKMCISPCIGGFALIMMGGTIVHMLCISVMSIIPLIYIIPNEGQMQQLWSAILNSKGAEHVN